MFYQSGRRGRAVISGEEHTDLILCLSEQALNMFGGNIPPARSVCVGEVVCPNFLWIKRKRVSDEMKRKLVISLLKVSKRSSFANPWNSKT